GARGDPERRRDRRRLLVRVALRLRLVAGAVDVLLLVRQRHDRERRVGTPEPRSTCPSSWKRSRFGFAAGGSHTIVGVSLPPAVDGATSEAFSAAVAAVQSGILRRQASRVRSYERSARFDAAAVAFA